MPTLRTNFTQECSSRKRNLLRHSRHHQQQRRQRWTWPKTRHAPASPSPKTSNFPRILPLIAFATPELFLVRISPEQYKVPFHSLRVNLQSTPSAPPSFPSIRTTAKTLKRKWGSWCFLSVRRRRESRHPLWTQGLQTRTVAQQWAHRLSKSMWQSTSSLRKQYFFEMVGHFQQAGVYDARLFSPQKPRGSISRCQNLLILLGQNANAWALFDEQRVARRCRRLALESKSSNWTFREWLMRPHQPEFQPRSTRTANPFACSSCHLIFGQRASQVKIVK